MAADNMKPLYSLRQMSYPGWASAAISLFCGGEDVFEIQTDRRHVLDFDVIDDHDGVNFTMMAQAYTHGRTVYDAPDPYVCAEIEAVQILATVLDEYHLGCTVTGRKPLVQDKHTVATIRDKNRISLQAGYLPYVMVTDKIVLPDTALPRGNERNTLLIDEKLDDFFGSYERDYAAMMQVWGKETDGNLQKYDKRIEYPTQFVACRDNKATGFKIFSIEPFASNKLGRVATFREACRALTALEAGYIAPAPAQPAILQHWAQNVHLWERQSEGNAQTLPGFAGPSGHVLLN